MEKITINAEFENIFKEHIKHLLYDDLYIGTQDLRLTKQYFWKNIEKANVYDETRAMLRGSISLGSAIALKFLQESGKITQNEMFDYSQSLDEIFDKIKKKDMI